MAKIQTFRWVCLFAVFLVLVTISETGAAENIYVSPGESIQVAVDEASPGDTIFVKPGEYNESIQIDQDNLTIISDSKDPYDTVITGENIESNVFKVVASNVTISGFSIADSKCGIYLNGAQNCIINNNNISGNNIGICLFKSDNNSLSDNLVYSNADCGIKSFTSSGNAIYNNYFNNTNNARDDKFNIWNLTSGNCWSDYEGKDEDGDGVGDTVYAINRRTKSIDYRPLMDFSPQLPVFPEAIFTSNVTAGYAPLTVEFTDFSENASSLLWSLENLETSNSSDFLHTFVNEGNYTVALNVMNENGSDSTYVTINVLKA
ncbi:MAG TPA: NosD domain-containing protein, partial [Methanosarcina sp.]|nr:NosD domain-containing protein [Methanosarcina sp.]